jgi:hypothetical protein
MQQLEKTIPMQQKGFGTTEKVKANLSDLWKANCKSLLKKELEQENRLCSSGLPINGPMDGDLWQDFDVVIHICLRDFKNFKSLEELISNAWDLGKITKICYQSF